MTSTSASRRRHAQAMERNRGDEIPITSVRTAEGLKTVEGLKREIVRNAEDFLERD